MARSAKGRRRIAETRGRRAEWVALAWYALHGWRIVGRRMRTPRGEVDLVVRRGRVLCFVEVKWRATRAELALAIDERRLARVAAAAEALAARHARSEDNIRVDVFLVAPGAWPRRIENAWQPVAS
jgi:putative endonuclease